MKIEVIRKGMYKWYFRIRANNGKILCHSEMYKRKRSCINAINIILDPMDCKIVEL